MIVVFLHLTQRRENPSVDAGETMDPYAGEILPVI